MGTQIRGGDDLELPKRKNNRLCCFDYRNPGYYFITICTKNREKLFWIPSISKEPILSEIGWVVDRCIRKIPEIYPLIRLDQYVIMPNHVHLILIHEGHEENLDSSSISNVIGQMKRAVSKMTGKAIWQASFHDHVIRSEVDYQKIWQYIEDNPRKWKEDCYFLE